jgi:hypothetical protein
MVCWPKPNLMRKVLLRFYLFACFAAGFLPMLPAQCPSIAGCPQGLAQFCDYTDNDSLLWNTAPYTWAPGIASVDVPEGNVDLTLRVYNPCGVSPTVTFVLLLDLDSDDIGETAVPSVSLPPPGRVLVNSAFTPNLDEGDTLWYDKRVVPDSMKYQFTLVQETSGDTLLYHIRWNMLSSPGTLIVPRLPEGRHRVQWRVVHNGQTKACDYNFRVRDCVAPDVLCQSGVTVAIDSAGPAVVSTAGLLLSADDNITPPDQLQFALRRAGTGTGFPLGPGGLPADTLRFECNEASAVSCELWCRDRTGNAGSCTTTVQVVSHPVYCYVAPPPPPSICARPFWNPDWELAGTAFRLLYPDPTGGLDTLALPLADSTCSGLAIPPGATTFTLGALRDDSPMNGISTFDLVLISRHILNVAPLDAPWKIVAADVNRNGSVSAQDIVELRKLILGISTALPGNHSPWRFFTSDCSFGANPFTQFCPSTYTYIAQPLDQYPPALDFYALKVGDVNASVYLGPPPPLAADRRAVELQLPDRLLPAGEAVDLPVVLAGGGAWLGAQFALAYDPAALEIEAVEPGLLAAPADYTALRPADGEFACSWETPRPVESRTALVTLRVRARIPMTARDALRLSERLAAEAYAATGGTSSLQLAFPTSPAAGRGQIEPPQPNPTSGGVTLAVTTGEPLTAHLALYDAVGRSVYRRAFVLGAGRSMVEAPAEAFPHGGLYHWRLQAGTAVEAGKIVRQ